MTLLAPLGLLAAAAVIPLVVWYLLRPRRRRQVVGSTFLWRTVDRPATAATPWQRFRSDATFWLVLLALLALALALARPGIPVPAQLGDHTILVVDGSGSMLAEEDGGVTRADLARQQAAELVADLSPGQEVSVVLAGTRPEVIVSATSDPREVTRALARIPGSDAPADLVDALVLATSLQRPGERTVVHVLTDGSLPADAAAAAPPGTGVSVVGSHRPNVAITRLTAAAVGAGDHRILVQVRSFASRPMTGRLILHVDDIAVVEQPLRLAPRATEDVLLTVPASGGQHLTAELVLDPDDDGQRLDALPRDDVATTVLADPTELTVLVAGPGNHFLVAALESVGGVTVETTPVVPADLAGVDLLVVDRVAAPALPPVPTLLVAPTSYPEVVGVVGEAELPVLTYQATDHPLLADVDLTGVAIAASVELEPGTLTPLASGPQGPLLLAGRMAGVPVVVLPFDLLASDLPLRPAWPLLIANTVSWATGGELGAATVPAGSAVAVDAEAATVEAHPPDGSPTVRVTVGIDGTARLVLDRIGLWRVDGAGDAPLFLPVVAAPEEGDLERTRVGAPARVVDDEGGLAEGIASLVRPIALAALVLALFEWVWSQLLAARWGGWRRERAAARADEARAKEALAAADKVGAGHGGRL